MQKKIIALAIAGLVSGGAFAQASNVTISGVMTAGYEQSKWNGTTAVGGFGTENRLTDQSSRVIISGEEALGGGTSAWFQVDSRVNLDISAAQANGSSAWAGGNSGVGLKGAWGKLTLGKWDLHYNEFAANGVENYSAAVPLIGLVGHGIMSAVNANAIATRTRTQNVFKYDTPDFSGVNGTFAYSTNPVGAEGAGNANAGRSDGSQGSAYQAAVRYANGPIQAFLSVWNYDIEGRGAGAGAQLDQRSTRAGFAYAFPMGLKLGIGYDTSTVKNAGGNIVAGGALAATAGIDQKRNAWILNGTYTAGANAFYATYASAGRASNVVDSKAKEWSLGYGYSMSKRTTLAAYYNVVNNSTGASYAPFAFATAIPNAGADTSTFYAGIAHTF